MTSLIAALLMLPPAGLHADPPGATPTVYAGRPWQPAIALTNRSGEPIRLLSAERSCGCLRVELPPQPIPAGGTASVRIAVRTLGLPAGPRRWTVTLLYKQGEEAEPRRLDATISATVVQEVEAEPAELFLSGESPRPAESRFRDRRATPAKVTGCESSSPHVRAEWVAGPEPGLGTLKVEAAEGCPFGVTRAEVVVRTDDPAHAEWRVPVQVSKFRPQRVRPTLDELRLTAVPGGPTASEALRLRDPDGEEVVVESAASSDPAVSAKFAAGPGRLATVRATLGRDAPASGEAALTITLAAPKKEVVVIPVKWSAAKP